MKGRYWLDANTFIWGSREPYPMPGAIIYWQWLESVVQCGKVTSHRKVLDEVFEGQNKKHVEPVVPWLKARKAHFDPGPDTKACQELVGQLCQYAYDTFGSARTVEFTKGADLWLVARAKLESGTVVTQESTTKLVRIPQVCKAFDVRHRTMFQMNTELDMDLGKFATQNGLG